MRDVQTSQALRHGVRLPWSGQPFDVMADDLDRDGRQDITVIDHGANLAQSFLQTQPRVFISGPVITAVGFHPGNLIRWPGEKGRYVLSAEGDNAVRNFLSTRSGGLVKISEGEQPRPRWGAAFTWPGWGDSLALAPFDVDHLILLKDYHPKTAQAAARWVLPLADRQPSLLWPGRITVADLDGDKIDELIVATSVTRDVFAFKHPPDETSQPGRIHLAGNPKWGGPNVAVPHDMDDDGDIDLLVPDETGPGKINVLINRGDGQFDVDHALPSANDKGITRLLAGRDQDGQSYILSAGFGKLSLYQVPAGWQPDEDIPRKDVSWNNQIHASALALQDLDHDGSLDLVLGRGAGESNLWVVFGPLWEKFTAMSRERLGMGFELN